MNTLDRDALALISDLRQATTALALELPAAVWDDYSKRLDAVIELVRPAPAPAQTIDRDALVRLLAERWWDATHTPEKAADDVLALLRPTDGVTLTRDEAALVAQWGRMVVQEFGPHPTSQGAALAQRLEAAQ